MIQSALKGKRIKPAIMVGAIFLSLILVFNHFVSKDTSELEIQESIMLLEVYSCEIENMRSRKEIQYDLDFEYDKAKKRALQKELKELEQEIQKVCG